VNSFLADGGDGFTVLRGGSDRVVGGLDVDALAAYLTANRPIAPPATDRITSWTCRPDGGRRPMRG
jgi:5'-nucleotidase